MAMPTGSSNWPGSRPAAAELRQVVAVRVEDDDALVAGVHDVHVVQGVDRDAARSVEGLLFGPVPNVDHMLQEVAGGA